MRGLLESVFGPLDALLGSVPLAAGRWIIVGFLVLSALAALALPRWYVLLGAPDRRWYRDLRLWALAFMLPYVVIYVLL